MPQDIPLERGETLRFTPACLLAAYESGKIDTVPVFTLGTPTPRDNRARVRWLRTLSVRSHSSEACRAEFLAGLKALGGEEQFKIFEPEIKALWQAKEDFALQKADDPDLQWSYDAAKEKALDDLHEYVAREWRPFGRMLADNGDYEQMIALCVPAIGIKFWSGFGHVAEREDGVLTLECVEEIPRKLAAIEEAAGLPTGVAWLEIQAACLKRQNLDVEEAKNSASPSLSDPPPPSLKTGDDATAGTSKVPATSKKIPAKE